jgi:HEAT repeat protein
MGLFSWLGGRKPEEASQPEPEQEELPAASVAELSEALSSTVGALRVDAARALLEQWRGGDARAAEALAPRLGELLEDDEPLARLAALSGVRLLRKPENLARNESAVVALLNDEVAQVRTAAVWAALKLPSEAARQQVRALLSSDEEPMRFAAACALSDSQDAAALPELVAALKQDHRRQEALSALMSLGDAAAAGPVGALFEDESLGEFDRTLVAATLARFGDARGGEHLVARLEENGDDRPVAAEWAGRLGVQAAVPALTELAEAVDEPARGAAIRALGRLKAPGAEEQLLALLGSAETAEDLRMDAAEGLAELGTPQAIDALRAAAGGDASELTGLCQELLLEISSTEKAEG